MYVCRVMPCGPLIVLYVPVDYEYYAAFCRPRYHRIDVHSFSPYMMYFGA